MSIKRVFLDWRQAALPAAAEFLLARTQPGPTLDLRRVIVGVPAARAGRRLLEILVDRAADLGRGLIPPKIITVGRLPELLYEAKRPFAGDFTQHLAWVQVLQGLPRERLMQLVRQLPDPGDLDGWLAVAELLATLHRELAADGLNFEDVLKRGSEVPGFDEAPRWRLLHEIRDKYLRLLDSLDLWDLQTARLVAIEKHECHADHEIVLVGAVDLNRAQRAMLDQVADHVTALVFAPEELAERFDEHGCLIAEAWQEVPIDGVFERTEIVDGPADQAAAVVSALAGFNGRYAAEDIVVGVPDKSLAPWIAQRLEECGLPARYSVGTAIPHTGPGRLLRSVAEFLERRTFAALSALVRHPDLELRLKSAGAGDDWLSEFDDFYCERLPFGVPDSEGEDHGLRSGMRAAIREVLRLTAGLSGTAGLPGAAGLPGPARPPADWAAAILELLLAVYAGRDLDQTDPRDRAIVVACEKIREAVEQQRHIPSELAPRISGAEALRHVLETLAEETVPPLAGTAAIELVGWLELPLDDAPALVVTGFNEGFVPSSLNADAFLPNELRRRLQLNDNARRYARDAYALSLLVHARRELKIIAGRRSAEGDPLVPSRLLFACAESELPQRVLRSFSPAAKRPQPLGKLPACPTRENQPPKLAASATMGTLAPGRARAAFDVPPPRPLAEPVAAMPVTEFSEYLKCPYRYYLKRRLRLKAQDTSAEELDGLAFGNLIHNVLAEFAASEVRSSTVAGEIVAFLDDALDREAQQVVRGGPLPAVAVQLEQIRLRLKKFAEWQAGWAADGWRIAGAEWQIEGEGAFLLVDGAPMRLRGRIDRIDVRETSRGLEFVVLDYKTGDGGRTPEQTHRRQSEWIDLQLPLYRHLVRALEDPVVEGPIQLGYILLPRDVRRIGAHLAEWSPADLEAADRVAHDVVRAIRRQIFWPASPEFTGFDEFAAICQAELLRGAIDAEPGGSEPDGGASDE